MKLEFKDDAVVETEAHDKTLLELSLENGIPHIHECYGSARCSTCRVRVISGLENLSVPSDAESRIKQMKGWPDHIRLACQARPLGDVVVKRLVLDQEDIRLAWSEVSRLRSGVEKEIAVLFLDVEKFTGFTEKNLPYDVIHIMNKFFNRIGDAVIASNGYIDKFIGDSVMALFGIEEEDPRKACLDAASCAVSIVEEMNSFNAYLEENFHHEFRIRIGISAGFVILGNLGHRDRAQYTAIGDAVNTASRLEQANKKAETRVLISSRVAELAEGQIRTGRRFETTLRGQSQSQIMYELLDVSAELRQGMRTSKEEAGPPVGSAAAVADLPSHLPAWETDNDHTEIGFEIDYLTTSVRGIFRMHLVDIRYDETRPEGTALNAIIKTASIDTFVSARDNHLRSPDFFDSEKYPNMSFNSAGVVVKAPDRLILQGDLTIRDVKRRVDLHVRVCPPQSDAWGVYKRGFVAETTVDRYDFGILFNLPLPGGAFAIGQQVRIRLILQINRVAQS